MGLRFSIGHASLVAYFTTPPSETLECTIEDARDFFSALAYDTWRLISNRREEQWKEQVSRIAHVGLDAAAEFASRRRIVSELSKSEQSDDGKLRRLHDKRLDDPTFSVDEILGQHVVQDLRSLLREQFEWFILAVSTSKHHADVTARLQLAASTLRAPVLFLLPDPWDGTPFDLFDPFPGAADIGLHPERWPGVLVWDRKGASQFVPLNQFQDVLPFRLPGNSVPKSAVVLEQAPSRTIRILHLSDLHFGTKYAAKNQAYLIAAIADQLEGAFDKIVITGDFFDSPWKPGWQKFEMFRTALRALTKSDPILVPGNHDYRVLGNSWFGIGKSARFIAELGARSLIECDDDLECLFFRFDSAKQGTFARGEVSGEDLVRLGTEYHLLAQRKPEIKNWLRVALVHHHPFRFESAAEGATAKLLKQLKIPESHLVDMIASERFVQWCADRGVQLILHGHRHVQRKITQLISVEDGDVTRRMRITSVGCGTSLGAEGIPSTFNLITWSPKMQTWSTSFYQDRHGGGFKQVRAVVAEIDPLSRQR